MNSLILYRELVSFLLLDFSIYFWWHSIISSARVEPAFFFSNRISQWCQLNQHICVLLISTACDVPARKFGIYVGFSTGTYYDFCGCDKRYILPQYIQCYI